MKILFVMQDVDYYPPLGLMQLSAIAKTLGHETRLLVLSRTDPLEPIIKYSPDIVCYGGSTGEHKFYVAFNKAFRIMFPKVISVIGGPHATFFPEVQQQGKFDVLIQGEGEMGFLKYLSDTAGPRDCRIYYAADIVEDLDTLPFPDRELFYDNPLTLETGQSGTKHFQVSRGCPYICSYCYSAGLRAMYRGKKYVRRHSVDYVLAEIAAVRAKYPLNAIKFYDDIFTYKVDDWLEEFCDRYPKEVGLPFFTLTRFDLLTDEMARLLKSAGCRALQMSIESVNERIRNGFLFRNMSLDQIRNAYAICKKHGIIVVQNCIIGLPTSTLRDEKDAINFVVDNYGKGYTDFPIYQPYPKTPLGESCIAMNIYDGDYENIHLSYGHHSVLSCFDKKYKNILRNLAVLGTVACRYPWTKWLILNVLIYLPYNRLFFMAFYLTKMAYHAKYIYRYKHSLKEWWRLICKSLRVESQKRF